LAQEERSDRSYSERSLAAGMTRRVVRRLNARYERFAKGRFKEETAQKLKMSVYVERLRICISSVHETRSTRHDMYARP